MNKWEILEIDETKDKNKIKEGYLSKLEKVHPEEDPEGFKLLRSAYEEALQFAKEEDREEELDEVDYWVEKAKKIYNTFSLRVNEEAWREILQEPISFALDTRGEVIEKLLVFFMESYYLPYNIWVLLNNHFNIIDMKEELCEKFPSNFIDYVINCIEYPGPINYDLFYIDDSKNYDGWIALYYKINNQLNNNEDTDIKSKIEELKGFGINHPYEDVLLARYYINNEKIKEAREIIENLIKDLGNDIAVVYCMAEIEWTDKNYEEAEVFYKKVLEIDDKNFNARIGLADVFLESGKVLEAREMYNILISKDPYNGYLRVRMKKANEKIIDMREKEGIESIEDINVLFDLAWCYYENSNYQKSIDLALKIEPKEPIDGRQRFDILGRSYSSLEKHEEALKYFEKWLDDELNSNCDDEEDRTNKTKRIAYVYDSKGKELFELEKYEEALDCYNEALKIKEDNVHCLINKCEVLYKLRRYQDSLELSDTVLKINNSVANIYYYRAEAMFHLKYYNDTIETCDMGISLFPYYNELYILKLKVYSIYKKFDKILEIIEETRRLEIIDEKIDLYNAKALVNQDKIDEGFDIFKKLMASEKKEISSRAYYEVALKLSDYGKFDEALETVNIAIEIDKDFIDSYYLRGYLFSEKQMYDLAIEEYEYTIKNDDALEFSYYQLGIVYKEMGNIEKAKECFHKVVEFNAEHLTVYGDLSEVYEAEGNGEKALEYVSKQLEINPSEYHYIYRGLIYDRCEEMEKAKEDYEKALEINPNSKHAYYNMGHLYQKRGKFNEAIKYYKKSIEVSDDGFVLPYNNISDCYMYIKNYDMSLFYLNEGIEKMPNQESLYSKKGKLLRLMHKYKESIETFEKGINIGGTKKEEYYSEIAETYKWMGENKRAISFYKKALKLEPESEYFLQEIAELYEKRGKYNKALKYIKKLIEVSDSSANNIVLGDCYRKAGDIVEAKKYYEKAIDICNVDEVEDIKGYINLGQCYGWLGNIEEATRYFNKAISVKPCEECKGRGCYEGYYSFGELYEENGNYELALKYYEKALEIEDDIKYSNAIDRVKKIIEVKDGGKEH